jgi:hypothetical protein
MSVQIGDNAQEESCCGSYENDKKKEQSHSPITNTGPSSSSLSSTPIRLRRLSDIYETCIFWSGSVEKCHGE